MFKVLSVDSGPSSSELGNLLAGWFVIVVVFGYDPNLNAKP